MAHSEYLQQYHNPVPVKRLTPAQNQVMYALQQGWQLITSNDSSIVVCANNTGQFEFKSSLFYRLYRMGLIGQRTAWPSDWQITKLGRETKTRPINLTPTN